MKCKRLLALLVSAALLFSACAASAQASGHVTDIVLSDTGITVDGAPITDDSAAAVYTGAEIVYYRDGTDETYGEGSESEKHTALEAAAHTVVTITQPGTYRLTGALSAGQIAIDLGEDAAEDPEAVVTIILDGADVTCTVAPALIFYNVYECGVVDSETASGTVDTSDAGANVILAAGSENRFQGSHVARIYKEGTTKKLHKYDGAFYSKMSMNIYGDEGDDSGGLHIVSDNEGLNSELHLTINGGTIHIDSQDDGINTNEDFVSVTTINGGNLIINAGQGAEGDGIDSNGYLTINGGAVWTMANERTPDGGIDADAAIAINGGALYAFGARNDAVSGDDSAQPYMELSFASTLPAGSAVQVTDAGGNELWSAQTEKACQAITLTTQALQLDTVYNVYVDGVLQCCSGNSFGMMGPGGMGGQRPEGMEPPEGFDPGQAGQPPEGMERPEGAEPGQPPEGMEPPEGFNPIQIEIPEGFDPGQMGGMPGFDGAQEAGGAASTEFVLTQSVKSFSGVCDDASADGKTQVSFTVEGLERRGRETVIQAITAITPSVEINEARVQVSVTDDPSENYAASCSLSDGLEAINALLPEDDGNYLLTVAVSSGTEGYTGATQISFTVGVLPFVDVREGDEGYEAIKALYEAGVMNGTGADTFSPEGAVTRAQAITIVARLAGAQAKETDAFTDVVSGSWYAGYVGWACDNGIVNGMGDGRFAPDAAVTAEHMALMISRYAALLGLEYTPNDLFTGELTRSQVAQMIAALL